MPLPWLQVESLYRSYLLTRSKRPSTCRTYVSSLRSFSSWCVGHEVDILTLDTGALSMYLTEILDRLSHNTAALRLTHIRSFYKFCRFQHWREDDPTAELSIKWYDIPPRQPYTDLEVSALLSACRNERDRVMLTLAYDCGLRVSEVVGIREANIRIDEGVIYLIGKGGKVGWCIPSASTFERLKPFLGRKDGILWWTKDNRPLTVKRAMNNMDNIVKRSGVKGHWHKLRTTFANRATEAGVCLEDLQVLMRHANISTTRHYAGSALDRRAFDVARQLNLAGQLDLHGPASISA